MIGSPDGHNAPSAAIRAMNSRSSEPGLRITLDLDRRAAEALRLELRSLARRHGRDPDAIRFEIAPRKPEPSM